MTPLPPTGGVEHNPGGYVVHRTDEGTEIHLDPARLKRLAGCAVAFNVLGVGCFGAFIAWPTVIAALDAPVLVPLPIGVLTALVWLAWWWGRKNYRRVMAGGSPTLVFEPSGRVTFGGNEVVRAGTAVAVRVEPREVSDGEGGKSTEYAVVVAIKGGAVALKAVDSWAGLGVAYVSWAGTVSDLPRATRFAARVADLLGVGVR